MTGVDRIRVELEALESDAPTVLPPSPPLAAERARWGWAPIAGILLAGVVLSVTGSWWLDHLRPTGSISPAPSVSHPQPSGPATTTLVWSMTPFAAPGAEPVAITAVGERLLITGRDEDGPAAWISDDDGATWARSTVSGIRENEVGSQTLGRVASHAGRLVALGLSQTEAAFISDDLGATWRRAERPLPSGAADIAAGPAGFVVVGDLRGFAFSWSPGASLAHWQAGAWVSVDGESWERSSDPFSTATQPRSVVTSVAQYDGTFAAFGYIQPDFPDGETLLRVVWLSTDGRTWELVDEPGLGSISEVTTGPAGFVAVGSLSAGRCRSAAWRSSDGRLWQVVELDHTCVGRGSDAHAIAAGPSGFVASGYEYRPSGGLTPVWWVPWFVQMSYEQEVDGQLLDITSIDDTFIGLGDCGFEADPCGTMLFVGRPPSAVDIVGDWQLVSGKVDDEDVPVLDRPTTMLFNGQEIGGKTPCNSYAAKVQVEGNRFALEDGILQTAIGCRGIVEEAERAFFEALRGVTEFAFDGEELVLRGPDIVLRFRRIALDADGPAP